MRCHQARRFLQRRQPFPTVALAALAKHQQSAPDHGKTPVTTHIPRRWDIDSPPPDQFNPWIMTPFQRLALIGYAGTLVWLSSTVGPTVAKVDLLNLAIATLAFGALYLAGRRAPPNAH